MVFFEKIPIFFKDKPGKNTQNSTFDDTIKIKTTTIKADWGESPNDDDKQRV